eukprot:707772-Pyramimonas_sp.AAC.1
MAPANSLAREWARQGNCFCAAWADHDCCEEDYALTQEEIDGLGHYRKTVDTLHAFAKPADLPGSMLDRGPRGGAASCG